MHVLAALLQLGLTIGHAQYALRPPWPSADGSDPLAAMRSSQLQPAPGATAVGANGQPLVFDALKKKDNPNGTNANANSRTPPPQMPQMPSMGGMGGGGGRSPSGSDDIRGSGRDGSVSAGAVKDCGSAKPDPTALQTALECVGKKLSVVDTTKMALADVDGKVMFIIDRQTKQPTGCVQISTGKNGTGSGYGKTGLGLVITGPHKGGKYQSNATGTERDSFAMCGTDATTKEREQNGAVFHKAHGGAGRNSTLGCIGIEDSQFDAVKAELYGSDANPKRTPVFIFDRSNREKCSIDGGKGGSGSGGDSQEATS